MLRGIQLEEMGNSISPQRISNHRRNQHLKENCHYLNSLLQWVGGKWAMVWSGNEIMLIICTVREKLNLREITQNSITARLHLKKFFFFLNLSIQHGHSPFLSSCNLVFLRWPKFSREKYQLSDFVELPCKCWKWAVMHVLASEHISFMWKYLGFFLFFFYGFSSLPRHVKNSVCVQQGAENVY